MNIYSGSLHQLLNRTGSELHQLFSDTYGGFYQRHSALFGQMFDNLTAFYEHGQPEVDDTLDQFFSQLYQSELLVQLAACQSD